MEADRQHFAAKEPKSFAEFAFLQKNYRSWLSKRLIYQDILGKIGEFKIISNELKNYKAALSSLLKDSTHGKGKETLMDKKVRNSKEILGKEIMLTDEFTKILQSQADEMAEKMGHPKQIELS